MKTLFLSTKINAIVFGILLLTGWGQATLSAQNCTPGNITLTTQTQIDNFQTIFGPCNTVTGNLVIQDNNDGIDNITNLAGLSNVTSIGGYLNIRYNGQLANLDGLENVTFIGNGLYFSYNDQLANLAGLSNVASIGAVLYIRSNDQLDNLDGLENVAFIGENLYIFYNDKLTNLDGLSNAAFNVEDVLIFSNGKLANLDGLSNMASIGGYLSIGKNGQLANIDGLSNVASIGGYLEISSNYQLANLEGLSNVASIGEYLAIRNNGQLANLDGLSNAAFNVEDVLIFSNGQLANLDGLSNMASIPGYMQIYDNAQLTNLDGLSNVASIGEYMWIYNNVLLSECCGLNILLNEGSVGGSIYIGGNMGNCNNNGNDIQGPCAPLDPCLYTGAPGQVDSDCDGIEDACDLCPGGDDSEGYSEGGTPLCADAYLNYEDLPAEWRCGNNENKVLICHNGNTLCVSPNSLAGHLAHGDYIGPCGNASCGQNLIAQPGGQTMNQIDRFQLFPNPADREINLKWESEVSGRVAIQVVDLNGRVLFSNDISVVKGRNSFSYPVDGLTNGIYFLKITSDLDSQLLRFVKSDG